MTGQGTARTANGSRGCPTSRGLRIRTQTWSSRTAQLLAQTARAQLRDGGEMTMAAIAERAGEYRSTAYRYFVSNSAATRPPGR
jgi:hypothetical protein